MVPGPLDCESERNGRYHRVRLMIPLSYFLTLKYFINDMFEPSAIPVTRFVSVSQVDQVFLIDIQYSSSASYVTS